MNHRTPHILRRRRGTILIVTILISFALAGMVVALCRTLRVDNMAAGNEVASIQADSVERAGEQYMLGVLNEEGQNITDVAEDQFTQVPVGDGFFWIMRPDYNDSSLPVFGPTSESAKVNINTATYDSLLQLPNMPDSVAGAIIDWRDADDDVGQSGAESPTYLALPEAYYCKNALFETVEELLMVHDMRPELLYGDGTAGPLGRQASRTSGSNTLGNDWETQHGWYDLLTIFSQEPNTAADGSARVNLRDRGADARSQLQSRLETALGSSRANEIMALLGRQRPVDVFDFATMVKLSPDELDKVADYLSTVTDQTLRGRINVNAAPRDVLLCLDGMDSSDVDRLISQRNSSNPQAGQVGWISDALGDKAVGLGAQITTQTYQWTADIVGVSGNGRAFKRCRVVIDTRTGTPQIVYRRDITDRGWPMDSQILASIRGGNGPGNVTGTGNTMGLGANSSLGSGTR